MLLQQDGLHATNPVAITKHTAIQQVKKWEPAKASQLSHRDRDVHHWSRPEDDGVFLCHFALPSRTGGHAKRSPSRRGSRASKCRDRNAEEPPLYKLQTKNLTLSTMTRSWEKKKTLNLHSKKNPKQEEEENYQTLEKGKKEKKTVDLSGIPS